MSIAGSDSGGGAGIQTDLKAFTALKTWGTTAVTCLTAQNPSAVRAVMPATPAIVTRQIAAIGDFYKVTAVKTGMLHNAGIIRAVVRELKRRQFPFVVVDPVMVATSGARLLQADAVRDLRNLLLPLATLITPNVPEAEVLAGMRINTLARQAAAAEKIASLYNVACVVKGGHLPGRICIDLLHWHGREWRFSHSRLKAKNTHGTGCAFSAAAAAWLARGKPLPSAVRHSQQYVRKLLEY